MSTRRQRIAITGASGLIGGALSSFLQERGDEVVHLVRRDPTEPHERRELFPTAVPHRQLVLRE